MLEKVFDSADFSVSDRVDAWCEAVANSLSPNEIHIDRVEGFHASLRAVDLGDALVTGLTYASLRSRRTPRLIRQSDPEHYAVGLVLSGQQGIEQQRSAASCTAGDLVVYSTSHPYDTSVDVPRAAAASVVVQVPRATVPLPSRRVDRLMATPLPGRDGVGGLLTGFLTSLATGSDPFPPADKQRLGGVLVDLITVWLAHHLDATDQTPVDCRRRAQFLKITSFLQQHLNDPELTPATVAAAHHISLRSLHRLFQDHAHGATVASTIRGLRLGGVRRDLTDPRLANRPIHAIATRWGFTRPADFTRAFRTHYGITPSDCRRLADPQGAQDGARCVGPGTPP
ncbi:helix-turn-helix domain-containing protein [Streptomyces sp. NPDC047315]|uniref:AraC-like ligand-binding domain-containing protein n=1 Tax=Streptomyces sp. NPDC047315 TaxID=3155142 RepID=UPI0033C5384C